MQPTRRQRTGAGPGPRPLYVVEHMEEGLESWCRLEYIHMCETVPHEQLLFLRLSEKDAASLVPEESAAASPVPAGAKPPRRADQSLKDFSPLCGSSNAGADQAGSAEATCVSSDAGVDQAGSAEAGNEAAHRALLPKWDRICLLDMDAKEALEPEDTDSFDALVFGGILGNVHENEDGSYGSDDRTSELRDLGFVHRRHLGPMQMTTDTALLVTRMVLEQRLPLAEIPFIDSPEIGADAGDGEEGKVEAKDVKMGADASDCVCMEGFRYVARLGPRGWEPVLPKGMRELLIDSADDDIMGSL